jgi:hypothetical protein
VKLVKATAFPGSNMIKQFIDHVKKMVLKGIFLARQNHKHLAFFPHLFLTWAQKTAALPGSSQNCFSQKDFYSLTHHKKSSRSIFQWLRTQRKIE